ncbi:MAG: mucoidy inhibitor MuiA family protein [Spirochaetota bacterium]|nr:mucoidy inhibitor MuiA family protein [Spirochaetota bacterium]
MNEKKSNIIEATVYPDRALVSREIEIQVTPDTKEILFDNLPSGIYRNTIRISGKGNAEIRIEGIDIRDEYLEILKDEEIIKQEKELEELQDKLSWINSSIDSFNMEKEIIKGVQNLSSSRFATEFYFRKTDMSDISNIFNFIKSNIERIDMTIMDLEDKKFEIEKEIARAKAELSRKSSMRSKEVVNCYISLDVKKPGKFSFYLTYVIGNASWSSVYDARLNITEKEIEIFYYGRVSQSTGENWEDVKLFLSTARPEVSATLPELKPWFIDFGYMDYDDRVQKSAPYGAAAPEPIGEESEIISASLNKGLSVTFGIKDSQKLPPDGTEKKVLIAKQRFPVELYYRAFPEMIESVFIRGMFENTTEYPLLAGSVKVYHNQDYIGDSFLETTVPSEKAKLSLGSDDSIKVKRELLKHFTQQKGVMKGLTRTIFRYTITLENYKEEEVKVAIEERVPISQNKELKVQLTEVTDSINPDYKGVLIWNVDIDSQDKKKLNLEYYVEYPVDKSIVGLNI